MSYPYHVSLTLTPTVQSFPMQNEDEEKKKMHMIISNLTTKVGRLNEQIDGLVIMGAKKFDCQPTVDDVMEALCKLPEPIKQ